MPIYDYKCDACNKEEAIDQKLADYDKNPIVPTCCESKPMRRHYFTESKGVKQFILLGFGGWHRDEYTKYRSIK